MKNEYIRKQDAIDAVKHAWAKGIEPSQYIESLEPADIVTVVRCKDCQYLNNEDDEVGVCYHMNGFGGVMPKDGFCSKGERRT